MEDAKYIKCANCGNYFEKSEAIEEKYCSWSCHGDGYKKCIICGKYYFKVRGFSDTYCSEECAHDTDSEIETKY